MNNKIPCGGFYLSDTLGVDENGKLGVNGGEPYKSLVTDGEGNVKWEDSLAYEYKEWKDFTLSSSGGGTEITGFTMPPVGSTVTVKVNGAESVETVKSGEINELSYSYIGSTDIAGLSSGTEGWCIANADSLGMIGQANPETTISLFITEQHKIDEKYIQQDKNFVRPLSYYIGDHKLFKPYYNESGEKAIAYKCDSFKHLPHEEEIVVYDLGNIGLGKFAGRSNNAFIILVYILTSSGIRESHYIYGTNETAIAELAADYGFTLTTKPTT